MPAFERPPIAARTAPVAADAGSPATSTSPDLPDGLDRPPAPAAFIPSGGADDPLDGRPALNEPGSTLGPAPPRPKVVRVPRKEGPRIQPDLVGKQQLQGQHVGDRYVRVVPAAERRLRAGRAGPPGRHRGGAGGARLGRARLRPGQAGADRRAADDGRGARTSG